MARMPLRKTALIIVVLVLCLPAYVAIELTENSDIEYVLLNAMYKKNPTLRWLSFRYLAFTNRIYTDSLYPQNIIGFVIGAYGEEQYDIEAIEKLTRMLVAREVDVNELSPSGDTALHGAVLFNQPKAVRFLLSIGANPKVKADLKVVYFPLMPDAPFNQKTPLEWALWLQNRQTRDEDRSQVIEILRAYESNTRPEVDRQAK